MSRSPTDVGRADYWLDVLGSEYLLRGQSGILVSVGMTIYLLWLVAIGSHGAFPATYGVRFLLDLLHDYRFTRIVAQVVALVPNAGRMR